MLTIFKLHSTVDIKHFKINEMVITPIITPIVAFYNFCKDSSIKATPVFKFNRFSDKLQIRNRLLMIKLLCFLKIFDFE